MRSNLTILALCVAVISNAQPISKTWVADNGNGTYKNPVLHADYSDPDAVRVGEDFYMIASSFEDVPGIPILHSKDLVNWKLVGHALSSLTPKDHFAIPRHGEGVWAPAIRYYKDEFYIYYPDPDFGIHVIKSKSINGPWSEPVLVAAGKGLIDPCPLWDDDGNVYLVHAFAGSRAGIKSIIVIKKMNSAGTKASDETIMVYDGHALDPTIEGPKFYKRNGYYYIFAPAGGVSTGWQTILRSKNVYGPYERKVVLDQGNTKINGPHQGAWVTTASGEDWFLHFQDKGAYGRIVHLQPMKWNNDWPVIGVDKDGDGKGEPVLEYKKPNTPRSPVMTPEESDEFSGEGIGLQWQRMANATSATAFPNPSKGVLTMFTSTLPEGSRNLWGSGNVLLQKFPAETFTITTKMSFRLNPKLENEKAGLVIIGTSYAAIGVVSRKDGLYLASLSCVEADKNNEEQESILTKLDSPTVYLRVTVSAGAKCRFSYSLDGKDFHDAGEEFTAVPGKWKGAKAGIFAVRNTPTNDAGAVEIDWFRVN